MTSVIVQKAVVVNEDNEILLLRRSKTDTRRPLQWDLPGGFLEHNEELLGSIEREVKEESGLEVGGLLLIYAFTEVRTWSDKNGNHTNNVTFLFYRASVRSNDVIVSSEHDKFQWCSLVKAIDELEYDLHIRALEHIRANNLLS